MAFYNPHHRDWMPQCRNAAMPQCRKGIPVISKPQTTRLEIREGTEKIELIQFFS